MQAGGVGGAAFDAFPLVKRFVLNSLLCKVLFSIEMTESLNVFSFCILGVTGLVSTDEKNDRNVDVDLWTMTNQETGEYGVSHG